VIKIKDIKTKATMELQMVLQQGEMIKMVINRMDMIKIKMDMTKMDLIKMDNHRMELGRANKIQIGKACRIILWMN